jgi:hypothetical protein|tara:strand:- start:399 stop:650 length:252 start_codon:yes stop_codon:yes gene_type:complete
MQDLPTYDDYVSQVNQMIESEQLSVEQGIILCSCFKATLSETPVHINYLMSATSLNWKNINYLLNGLVMRKAIRKIEQKYYMV